MAQRQVPGGPYVNEVGTAQRQVPGGPFVNETVASGASGTVAYTNVNDTDNITGTTTVVGTSARTNAADTSTASGTTTVTGTSARTNANDTANASGTVSDAVSGTVAVTNANDTGSISGTTTVVGTSSTTNATDTDAASGTTTVVGTSASTNAADTAAASGVAGAITGTVAYTNANDFSTTPEAVEERRRGGFVSRYIPARRKLPSAYLIDWLTNEEPTEETKRVIREIKAGRPLPERLDPPKVEKQITPEQLASKLIPRRLINLSEVLPVEQTQLIRKAVRIAQERDDEDILMLL